MKKALAIAGALALTFTPSTSFAGHIEPTNSIFREIRPWGRLHHVNLSGRDLRSSNMHSSNLSSANLSGANLRNAFFTSANLSGANLSSANLTNASLAGTNLSGANLNNANLSNANLFSADLSNANLSGAILNNNRASSLRGCPSSLPNGWVCEKEDLYPQLGLSLFQR